MAKVLVQRGIRSYDEAREFFRPGQQGLHDPYQLQDMKRAVARLLQAFQQQEKVVFLGDYDVDGTTAVTLMSLFAQDWGLDHEYYIPDRYKEGYGVSAEGVQFALDQGAAVLVTLDCGIKATELLQQATDQGLDVIVCDHHRPGAQLPRAVAVLDPQREDCDYPCPHLTGCGVAFKLLQALVPALCDAGVPAPRPDFDPFREYADLVTLSIACDIVPIVDENRIIAFHGLEKLRSNPLPGLKAMMDQAEGTRDWDISDLVFFLGPRVNSAGRLRHAREAVNVLLGQHRELFQLADDLQAANEERKQLDREMTEQALAQVSRDPEFTQKHSTVLFQPDWHKGVIGIVASRVIEHHYRPTIILTENDGKLVGSARSVSGFDLYEALEGCREHLLQFGGHKYAAGLTMDPSALPAFCKKFDEVVASRILPEQKLPTLFVDLEVDFEEIDARLIRILGQMEPFGPGNRRPVFLSREVKVLDYRVLKEQHIRLQVEQKGRKFEAIGFGLAAKWLRQPADYVDLAFQPIFNTWNQETRINLRLKDFVPTHESVIHPPIALDAAASVAGKSAGADSTVELRAHRQ